MENASKALIMAGGMLLAILIISLLIYAWSLFSKYQSSKDELADIEDTAKFNEQFANYDRDDVLGYELISLVNKIIDYNERKSNNAEDKNYSPITVTINFVNDGNRTSLCADNGNNQLFQQNTYKQSTNTEGNSFKKNIIDVATKLENNWGGSDNATKIAKGYNKMNGNEKANALKYYEYVQFKRAVFKSDSSSLKYDNVTGRISEMVFNFVKIR